MTTTVPNARPGVLMFEKAVSLALCAIALVVSSNYLTKTILPAFHPSNSDFSELYATSSLWRHGQNPYDPALATAARERVVGGSDPIHLINVPTALVLVAPFTFLPWGWANLLFLMLGTAGFVVTALAILRLQGRSSWGLRSALVAVFLLSFNPLRIAFQWGNIVLIVLPLAVLAIALAESKHDLPAGLLLALALCLKPQIGIWIGAYYLLRRRFRILWPCLALGLFITALFFLHPLPYQNLIASYRANLQYWFAPAGPYGFVEGSVPSLSLRTQGIFYLATRSVFASIWMAHALFVGGVALWGVFMWHDRDRIPAALAIAALSTLSFVSFYHSIPDMSVLAISLCDAFPNSLRNWTRAQKLTALILFFMMLPSRSIFVFFYHHLDASITRSSWWTLFFVRYLIWLLLALSVALLLRMHELRRRDPATVS